MSDIDWLEPNKEPAVLLNGTSQITRKHFQWLYHQAAIGNTEATTVGLHEDSKAQKDLSDPIVIAYNRAHSLHVHSDFFHHEWP